MQNFQPLIAPMLALVGTLLVALIGFYQWRRQNGNPNRAATAESRRKAAETLWSHLEEINLKLRVFGEDRRIIDISADLQEINKLFLRNSLYLSDSLQSQLNEYVKQLYSVSAVLEEYQEDREEWDVTMASPRKGVGRYKAVNVQLEKLESLRINVKNALLAQTDA